MLEDVAAAIERRDFKTATRLLKPLLQQKPHDPWVQLYLGQIQEAAQKTAAAEDIYRRLLRQGSNPKVALQARRGLDRIKAAEAARRQAAIAQASTDPLNTGIGFLVLKPVTGGDRPNAVQQLARIMRLDLYTAQMHLPSRGWRLYRTGAMPELQVYGEELLQSGIPAFWASLARLKALHVFRVQSIQADRPHPVAICHNNAGQLGSIEFQWSEVAQRVTGQLPIFEQVVDLGAWNKLKRKEQTQDYAQVCDLHLIERQSILRFCDRTYQFPSENAPGSGSRQPPFPQSTIRLKWNHLMAQISHNLTHVLTQESFTGFAETALDHLDLVDGLDSHINLFRKAETNWDPAFQLYSGLTFLHHQAQ
ncbi:MAG: tetratricopeptide repeat protein [Synechococcales bacterium]|nr:tetratricopeptide repeat protein [Synechococcales bacterium]